MEIVYIVKAANSKMSWTRTNCFDRATADREAANMVNEMLMEVGINTMVNASNWKDGLVQLWRINKDYDVWIYACEVTL